VKRPSAAVPRETLEALAARYGLGEPFVAAAAALLQALADEPDPPTTVRAPDEAVEVHVADSLTGLEVEELRTAASIADIGAGAGFPGLVLAAALPEARVDLIESARRKCEVIERLAEAARVSAHAVPVRAEDWARDEGAGAYKAATARAVAPLAVLLEYAAPLLERRGTFVAWKGARDPAEEASGAGAAAELGFELREIRPVAPYRGSRNRHLYVYSKVRPTPDKYPRRTGVAARKPLS
jgi:16S rRNA (guanine527-N7)-methyltransferase